MKGKLVIMALAVALLVGLVPPSSARAEDEFSHYDAETKTIYYNGQSCYVGDGCATYINGKNIVYVANISSSSVTLMLYVFPESNVELGVWTVGNRIVHLAQGGVLLTQEYLPDGVRLYTYKVNASTGRITASTIYSDVTKIFEITTTGEYYNEFGERLPNELWTSSSQILYSDLNVWECSRETVSSKKQISLSDTMFYSSDVGQESYYSFYRWCSDAELNCVPSTRTSLVYDEFVYNSWFDYVVTKNSDSYSVYQFYSNDSIEQFTEFVSYDNRLYLHLKDDITGADFFIKRFDYVADGWLCSDVTFCTLNYDELLDLGVVISNDNKLFYSSETIKTGELFGNTYYSKNTEFTQGFSGEVSPDHNPMISPTPVPPSSDDGASSEMKIITYTSKIKAEVKVDSVNMRDAPSLEGNAVASFIKTWSIDVLGYVYDADGDVWYYCKTMRDDMEYVGFIKAEYLTVLSVENSDFGFGDIDMSDAPELIETAKNSFIELLGLVGVVPMMIGAVFGFLPSWCLGVVCFSVVAICLVAIIKRG